MQEDWGFNDKELNDIQLSFHAEFCIELDSDTETKPDEANQTVAAIFKSMLGADNVSFAGELAGEAEDEIDGAMGDGFQIRGNDVFEDDESLYQDPDACFDSFTLCSSEKNLTDFASEMLIATDRLTAEPFQTSDDTSLAIYAEAENRIDPLALALHADEHSWLTESNRHKGRLSSTNYFALTTYREAIVLNFLLNVDTGGFSKRTSRAKWIEALTEAAETVDQTGRQAAIEIQECGKVASFEHIGGQGYEHDFERNHRLSVAMARSVARSAPKRGVLFSDTARESARHRRW